MARYSAGQCRRFAYAYLRTLDPQCAAEAAGLGDGLHALAQRQMQQAVDEQRKLLGNQVRSEDIVRRLAELAFGRANDCVRLALDGEADLDRLDLSLLAEIKRLDKGVEIKLVDRLRALELLAELGSGTSEAEAFLKTLAGSA